MNSNKVMKIGTLSKQLRAGLALGLITFGINSLHAAAMPQVQSADGAALQASDFQNVDWEQAKIDQLRHAYHLLEHADGDYGGHREAAMKALKRAAEAVHTELHWTPRGEEMQWKSDKKMREARRLLKELVVEGHGKEQPNIHEAIREIDKALTVR